MTTFLRSASSWSDKCMLDLPGFDSQKQMGSAFKFCWLLHQTFFKTVGWFDRGPCDPFGIRTGWKIFFHLLINCKNSRFSPYFLRRSEKLWPHVGWSLLSVTWKVVGLISMSLSWINGCDFFALVWDFVQSCYYFYHFYCTEKDGRPRGSYEDCLPTKYLVLSLISGLCKGLPKFSSLLSSWRRGVLLL